MDGTQKNYLEPSPYFIGQLKTPNELAIALKGALQLAATIFLVANVPWPDDARNARLAYEKARAEEKSLRQTLAEKSEEDRWPDMKQSLHGQLRIYNTNHRSKAYEAAYHLMNILEAIESTAKWKGEATKAGSTDESSHEGALCKEAGQWLFALGVCIRRML